MQKGRLTYEDLPSIYQRLSEDLPIAAAEHVPKSVSRKGYDTTGYAYQFCVNRLNEVLFGHWRVIHQLLPAENGETSKGKKTMYRKIVHMTIQIGNWASEGGENHFEILMQVEGYGGHESLEESSAYKGAYTNAFKKTAAMLGVGKKAFEGQLDEDYQSYQMELREQDRQERVAKQNQNNLSVQKENKQSDPTPTPVETPEQKKNKWLIESFGEAKNKGLSDTEFKVIVTAETKKESRKDLTLDEAREIYSFMKDNTPAALKEMAVAYMAAQQTV